MSKIAVFIDERVQDKEPLISQLSGDTDLFQLESGSDGIEQMAGYLTGRIGYDSIQIISHGSSGSITIGSTELDNGTLTAYADQLATIGRSLTDNGDLLLYGCNVGAGVEGEEFVASLAELTGADVAASDDLTGGDAVGGDWELEVSAGAISSVTPLSSAATQVYDHTLGAVDDYTLAKMSLVAYYDDPAHPNDKRSEINVLEKNIWNELLSDGWQILENLGDDNWSFTSFPIEPSFEDTALWGLSSGFSATVFGKGDEVVIAYRGTNDLRDVLGADVAAASSSVFSYVWNTQFTLALRVANTIKTLYGDTKNIIVTGHSLGGGLAELTSQMFGFSGATFDPVGVANLVQDNILAIFPEYADHFNISSRTGIGVPGDFTNYIAEHSLISGIPQFTADHLGTTETLMEGELIEFLLQYPENHPIKALLGFLTTDLTLDVLREIDYVNYAHSMATILEFMRQKNNEKGISYYGTSVADTVVTANQNDQVFGYAGNDTITSGDGMDTITGGTGNDVIDGGSGIDTVIFSGSFNDYEYRISYSIQDSSYTVIDHVAGRDGTDILTGIEFFHFSDGEKAASDVFTTIIGSDAGELLIGNELENQMKGGDGNDILEGKGGFFDEIDGGAGEDTAIFQGRFAEYEIRYDNLLEAFIIFDRKTGRDGKDFVQGVEQFQFDDGMKSAEEVLTSIQTEIQPGSGVLDYVAAHPVNSTTQMFPGHTMGEWSNNSSLAALRADGSVVTWGTDYSGGDSCVWLLDGNRGNSVASELDGTIDVVQVFSTYAAFAALRADGSVVTWGLDWFGGDSCVWIDGFQGNNVASELDGTIDVIGVYSTFYAFAALRSDGSVVTWGSSGGNSCSVLAELDGTIDVVQVFSTERAFAALRSDGSVVTWGDSDYGGDSGVVVLGLDGTIDVVQVFSTERAFAALRADGSVVTWGDGNYGGVSSGFVSAAELDGTNDVLQVFSTSVAFAALRADGSVVSWGSSNYVVDRTDIASKLDGTIDVVQVFSTSLAFAALRADGSVVTWGGITDDSDISAVTSELDGTIDVVQVFSTSVAFAALRADGSVVTWGKSDYGGDSNAVASEIDGTIDVVQVFSTERAFAALRADGSVVTWGESDDGGDSNAVASELDGTIDVVQVFSTTNGVFAALRVDGSVVTWGFGYNIYGETPPLHDVVDISNIYTNSTSDQVRTGTQTNDALYGNIGSDILWGYSGNDTLAGMAGDDLVYGGDGYDLLICGEGEGNDTYDGGNGNDTVKYTSALSGIKVDLAEGTAYAIDGPAAWIGTDTLKYIERIISGNYADLLIGNDAANYIEGGGGNDTLFGGDGADSLDGGEGSDTVDYSDKKLSVFIVLSDSADTIVLVEGVTDDTIRNIENLIGGSGRDALIGDAADNLFRGGDGKDTIDGGDGSDTADYSEKSAGVSVTLNGGSDVIVSVGGLAEDTLRDIENLIGGSGGDYFVGDAASNRLSGFAGNDTFAGGAGMDTIDGGLGDDTVVFSGRYSDYSFILDGNTGQIEFYHDWGNGFDGRDVIIGVEHFRFADTAVTLAEIFDHEKPVLKSVALSGYAVNNTVVLVFTDAVRAGTGTITLQGEGLDQIAIDVSDSSQILFDNNVVKINPQTNLALDAIYSISIGETAIVDINSNAFVGVDDYMFTTTQATHICEGNVSYWRGSAAMSGVTIAFDAGQSEIYESHSHENGEYGYAGLSEGDLTLFAGKTVTSNDASAIQASDALAALKIAFGMNPNGTGGAAVSAYQYLAADVNQNGKVEAADALNILKMAFNMSSAPAKEWEIVPESLGAETMTKDAVDWSKAGIPDITLDHDVDVHLVGVLMGDVNGSWTADVA